METNSKSYHDLFKLYKCSYSEKTAAKAQADFNLLWKGGGASNADILTEGGGGLAKY